MTWLPPPSNRPVETAPFSSSGSSPFSVWANSRTSSIVLPALIGAISAKCGCLPVLAKVTLFVPAFSPDVLKL